LNKKKILITGGSGFIGYHLAKRCLKLKWSVTSISTKRPKKIRKLKYVKYILCDISKKKELIRKIKPNYDYVVNLAGYVDHTHKVKTIKSHYNGCKNLSLIFLNSKIKKFIQIGSSVEYGKIKSPQLENKNNKQKTFSTYGNAKLLSTKYLLGLQKKFNFPATIMRLYLVYGPNQDENRVIPITIANAIKDKKFDCSSGFQLRDFIYVEDVVNAIIKTLRTDKVAGEIMNIGTGKPARIKNIIQHICYLVGLGKPQFGKIKLRKDEIIELYPNISKASRLLKWRPKITLATGLKKTIYYYKKKNG
jgi:nucleoside-diphosphate-sugar epimerase